MALVAPGRWYSACLERRVRQHAAPGTVSHHAVCQPLLNHTQCGGQGKSVAHGRSQTLPDAHGRLLSCRPRGRQLFQQTATVIHHRLGRQPERPPPIPMAGRVPKRLAKQFPGQRHQTVPLPRDEPADIGSTPPCPRRSRGRASRDVAAVLRWHGATGARTGCAREASSACVPVHPRAARAIGFNGNPH